MSNPASPQQALAKVQDAIRTWIEAANDLGHAIPTAMWYFDPDAAHDAVAIPEPGNEAGSVQGAGKRLEGYGPDRK